MASKKKQRDIRVLEAMLDANLKVLNEILVAMHGLGYRVFLNKHDSVWDDDPPAEIRARVMKLRTVPEEESEDDKRKTSGSDDQETQGTK